MDDPDMLWQMGKYLKHHRLKQNKTQEELSLDSGIQRETIARMENGSAFKMMTFICLLRHLNVLEEVMSTFRVPDYVSPSLYMKMRGKAPKRIRHTNAETKAKRETRAKEGAPTIKKPL